MNFVSALVYHFCLNLCAAFTQPGGHLLGEPFSSAQYHHTNGTNGLALGVIGDGLRRDSRMSDVCNGILQLIRFSLVAPLADKVAAVSVNERMGSRGLSVSVIGSEQD